MIFVYTSLLAVLGLLRFVVRRRVASLEGRYARAALEASRCLTDPPKEGNRARPDFGQTAKRYYVLGRLVQKRDQLEARHDAWLRRAETLDQLVTGVQGWKGRKLPYTFGAVDVSLLLYAVDYLGVGEYVNARHVWELATTLLGR